MNIQGKSSAKRKYCHAGPATGLRVALGGGMDYVFVNRMTVEGEEG